MWATKMQWEHKEWLDEMYPNQPVQVPALGLVEEAGELLHCVLKQTQESIWGKEARYSNVDWDAKFADAIGDCAIYMCSLCNALNMDFASLIMLEQGYAKCTLAQAAVQLVSTAAALYENRSLSGMMQYCALLHTICKIRDCNLQGVVVKTWLEVRGRKR